MPSDDNDHPENWGTLRRRVLSRDNRRCTDCGRNDAELHVHYITPVSAGGSHSPGNLRTLCRPCHECVHGRSLPAPDSAERPACPDGASVD